MTDVECSAQITASALTMHRPNQSPGIEFPGEIFLQQSGVQIRTLVYSSPGEIFLQQSGVQIRTLVYSSPGEIFLQQSGVQIRTLVYSSPGEIFLQQSGVQIRTLVYTLGRYSYSKVEYKLEPWYTVPLGRYSCSRVEYKLEPWYTPWGDILAAEWSTNQNPGIEFPGEIFLQQSGVQIRTLVYTLGRYSCSRVEYKLEPWYTPWGDILAAEWSTNQNPGIHPGEIFLQQSGVQIRTLVYSSPGKIFLQQSGVQIRTLVYTLGRYSCSRVEYKLEPWYRVPWGDILAAEWSTNQNPGIHPGEIFLQQSGVQIRTLVYTLGRYSCSRVEYKLEPWYTPWGDILAAEWSTNQNPGIEFTWGDILAAEWSTNQNPGIHPGEIFLQQSGVQIRALVYTLGRYSCSRVEYKLEPWYTPWGDILTAEWSTNQNPGIHPGEIFLQQSGVQIRTLVYSSPGEIFLQQSGVQIRTLVYTLGRYSCSRVEYKLEPWYTVPLGRYSCSRVEYKLEPWYTPWGDILAAEWSTNQNPGIHPGEIFLQQSGVQIRTLVYSSPGEIFLQQSGVQIRTLVYTLGRYSCSRVEYKLEPWYTPWGDILTAEWSTNQNPGIHPGEIFLQQSGVQIRTLVYTLGRYSCSRVEYKLEPWYTPWGDILAAEWSTNQNPGIHPGEIFLQQSGVQIRTLVYTLGRYSYSRVEYKLEPWYTPWGDILAAEWSTNQNPGIQFPWGDILAAEWSTNQNPGIHPGEIFLQQSGVQIRTLVYSSPGEIFLQQSGVQIRTLVYTLGRYSCSRVEYKLEPWYTPWGDILAAEWSTNQNPGIEFPGEIFLQQSGVQIRTLVYTLGRYSYSRVEYKLEPWYTPWGDILAAEWSTNQNPGIEFPGEIFLQQSGVQIRTLVYTLGRYSCSRVEYKLEPWYTPWGDILAAEWSTNQNPGIEFPGEIFLQQSGVQIRTLVYTLGRYSYSRVEYKLEPWYTPWGDILAVEWSTNQNPGIHPGEIFLQQSGVQIRTLVYTLGRYSCSRVEYKLEPWYRVPWGDILAAEWSTNQNPGIQFPGEIFLQQSGVQIRTLVQSSLGRYSYSRVEYKLEPWYRVPWGDILTAEWSTNQNPGIEFPGEIFLQQSGVQIRTLVQSSLGRYSYSRVEYKLEPWYRVPWGDILTAEWSTNQNPGIEFPGEIFLQQSGVQIRTLVQSSLGRYSSSRVEYKLEPWYRVPWGDILTAEWSTNQNPGIQFPWGDILAAEWSTNQNPGIQFPWGDILAAEWSTNQNPGIHPGEIFLQQSGVQIRTLVYTLGRYSCSRVEYKLEPWYTVPLGRYSSSRVEYKLEPWYTPWGDILAAEWSTNQNPGIHPGEIFLQQNGVQIRTLVYTLGRYSCSRVEYKLEPWYTVPLGRYSSSRVEYKLEPWYTPWGDILAAEWSTNQNPGIHPGEIFLQQSGVQIRTLVYTLGRYSCSRVEYKLEPWYRVPWGDILAAEWSTNQNPGIQFPGEIFLQQSGVQIRTLVYTLGRYSYSRVEYKLEPWYTPWGDILAAEWSTNQNPGIHPGEIFLQQSGVQIRTLVYTLGGYSCSRVEYKLEPWYTVPLGRYSCSRVEYKLEPWYTPWGDILAAEWSTVFE